MTESVSFVRADEKLTAFIELEGVTCVDDYRNQTAKPLVKENEHTPTLPCLAYKQKWPPKKDGHSCVWETF